MKAQETNQRALALLEAQEFMGAQTLFFENARKNPCHQTYNNLGYYLLTEGLQCKNGQVRNADRLGYSYLCRAAQLETSSINLSACAYAKVQQLDALNLDEAVMQQKEICALLEKASFLAQTDEGKYNALCARYFCDSSSVQLLEDLRTLIQTYITEESIALYLDLLRRHSLIDEGLSLLSLHEEAINDANKLLFFTSAKRYAEGYALCASVKEKFFMHPELIACIIECYVHAGTPQEVERYRRYFCKLQKDLPDIGQQISPCVLAEQSTEATCLRETILSNYQYTPSYAWPCGYFGCYTHNTPYSTNL